MTTDGTTSTSTENFLTDPSDPAYDPREDISVGVLLPNGRLVGRRFDSLAEARAWAREDEGEQVVEFNAVCDCEM